MDMLFVMFLAVWTGFSLLRFIDMYDRESSFQKWRFLDVFNLVPMGAFFGPSVPRHEPWILVRDFYEGGRVTGWKAVPYIRPRVWWHALWNPQKPVYTAKFVGAHALLVAAREVQEEGIDRIPMTFLMSEPYLALLRFASGLPRSAPVPVATQFAVLEIDLLTGAPGQRVLSSIHELENA